MYMCTVATQYLHLQHSFALTFSFIKTKHLGNPNKCSTAVISQNVTEGNIY